MASLTNPAGYSTLVQGYDQHGGTKWLDEASFTRAPKCVQGLRESLDNETTFGRINSARFLIKIGPNLGGKSVHPQLVTLSPN